MRELKVFKMDDCTWVIAESKDQAMGWYANVCEIETNESDIYEVNYDGLHEDAGYWKEICHLREYFKAPIIGMFKMWHGMFCEWIWFKDAIKSWEGEVPAVIATTEV